MRAEKYWEILGIEKNASRIEIKRAYAGLVKQFHPEDAPEDFARIRTAYETALTELETLPVHIDVVLPPVPVPAKTQADLPAEVYDFAALQTWDDDVIKRKVDIVIARMREIYEIIEFRRDRNNWEICFQMETCRTIMDTPQFALAFLTFLDTHRQFPCHMWRFFHGKMDLLRMLANHSGTFSELREYVSDCVFEVPSQYCDTFDYLRSGTQVDVLEQYIEKVIVLQLLMARQKTDEALSAFKEASDLINNDLELYNITAQYLTENDMHEEAERIRSLAPK